MAAGGDEMLKQLNDITECCICMKTFTDPRILPCVHTFCLKCLRKIASNSEKNSEEQLPCPVCRTAFTIPKTGLSCLQKNFFMEKLVEMTRISKRIGRSGDEVRSTKSGDSVELMRKRCLRCEGQSCKDCVKQNSSTTHKLSVDAEESEDEEEEEQEGYQRVTEVETKCGQHSTMSLEVYCHDCQAIICYKCLVDEHHKGHSGSLIDSVANEFREEIQSNLEKVSNYKVLSQGLRRVAEKQREAAGKDFDEKEGEILERSRNLKELVDKHTKELLEELSTARKQRLKEMETEREESERFHMILESSEVYFNDVKTKGSPTDVCRVKDEMTRRTNELGEILSRIELSSVKVSFQKTNLEKALHPGDNVVGKIKIDSTKVDPFEKCILVVGLSQDKADPPTTESIKIHLNKPIKVSEFHSASTALGRELAIAVNNNLLFVAGLGKNSDEIWKYHLVSGWIRCGSLVLGRNRHCVVFIGDILYICGGYADPTGILDSVEAFNTLNNRCATVGKLTYGVKNVTCVSYKSSIYVFYGFYYENKTMDDIQVYDTVRHTCTMLRGPSPRPFSPMNTWRAVKWETSVILVGRWTCFVFDLDLGTWKERKNLKVDVDYFGLILNDGNLYVVGGGVDDVDADDNWFWKRHDDVRCCPVDRIIRGNTGSSNSWRNVAKLPIPALVFACAVVAFPTE